MSPGNQYRTFSELSRHHRQNRDWRRILLNHSGRIGLIAPHGGGIEAGTSEIATAIAGEELSLYCFEGIRQRGNEVLHISSRRFDDPMCLDLLESTRIAVTIHGCAGAGEAVYVGGLHKELRVDVVSSLLASGFHAVLDATGHSGTDPGNLCNRCSGGRGLQLEITRGLRTEMFAGLRATERRVTTTRFAGFVSAVRTVLLSPELASSDPN